jgi:hypothetical protein
MTMVGEGRTRLENAVPRVVDTLGLDVPMTVNEIARRAGINWKTADKIVQFLTDIQDQLTAHEVVVLGGKNRRIVLLQMRVELSKLPKDVADWFIEARFFSKDEQSSSKKTRPTERVMKSQRVPIEAAAIRILETLEEKDEVYLSSLSRRAGIDRRTVTRALGLLVSVQGQVADFSVSRTEDGVIIRRALRSLYELDSSRIRYVLRKRYLHDAAETLHGDEEHTLLQMA